MLLLKGPQLLRLLLWVVRGDRGTAAYSLGTLLLLKMLPFPSHCKLNRLTGADTLLWTLQVSSARGGQSPDRPPHPAGLPSFLPGRGRRSRHLRCPEAGMSTCKSHSGTRLFWTLVLPSPSHLEFSQPHCLLLPVPPFV